jgi:hypothetical protein
MELDPHQHNSTAMFHSVHGIGGASDLSSIPEETEPNQPPPHSGQHSTMDQGLNTDKEWSSLNLSLCPTLSSAFLSPSPTPPSPIGSDPSKLDSSAPPSIWLAPEIQTLQQSSLLPDSIVEEM